MSNDWTVTHMQIQLSVMLAFTNKQPSSLNGRPMKQQNIGATFQ